MTEVEVDAFAELVVGAIKAALGPVQARLAALETRIVVPGRDGMPGLHGRDADPAVMLMLQSELAAVRADVVAWQQRTTVEPAAAPSHALALDMVVPLITAEVTTAVAREVAKLPPAQPGRDGMSVSVADIAPLVAAEVVKAVGEIPPAKDGASGADGKSIDPAEVEMLIATQVTKAVAAFPKPRDGQNGQDGKSLESGDVAPLIAVEVSKAVAALPVPADPIGVLGALIDRDGHLVFTLSNGATKDVGLVVGRDVDRADVVRVIGEEVAKFPRPKDGVDGKDGLGFDDLDVVFPDGRPHLRFMRGEQLKEFPLHTPNDQGIWKEGTSYQKGDGVTWARSFWLAQDTTSEKPGEGATRWRLTVKRGGDGKDGNTGAKGADGAPGRPGLDGRRL